MSRKRAAAKSSSTAFHQILSDTSILYTQPCIPPLRSHTLAYHNPLLLRGSGPEKLLHWFDGISEARAMPWRKPWTGGNTSSGNASEEQTSAEMLTTRAYEVLVSEIMLQQTRVATVIPYFTSWIATWPTVQDLAAASPEAVLAAWKGLGYYSRATRLHEAAQQVVNDFGGSIPADVDGLLRITGIGPYTAGAVSSIAFGRAVPLLDGNVARVLSRQLGLYARVKDKKVEDILWYVAKILVEGVSRHSSPEDTSSVPGRWNQALMELGSTICMPRPKCEACPIQESCRAYAEGVMLTKPDEDTKKHKTHVPNLVDIEDTCTLCLPLSAEDIPSAAIENVQQDSQSKKRSATSNSLPLRPGKTAKVSTHKQTTLGAFVTRSKSDKVISTSSTEDVAPELEAKSTPPAEPKSDPSLAQITAYCSLFPAREIKKTVPTQDSLVCIIKRVSNKKQKRSGKKDTEPNETHILLEQRPAKGLLANLWRFPTLSIIPTTNSETLVDTEEISDAKTQTSTPSQRRKAAKSFVQDFLEKTATDKDNDPTLDNGKELGSILHVFTHLKVRMHVFAFEVQTETPLEENSMDIAATDKELRRTWTSPTDVEGATLDTGSVRCWALYTGTGDER